MKRLAAVLLIAVLLLSSCVSVNADIADRQDRYNAALETLSRYLGRNDGAEPTDLNALQQEFMDIGVYQQAAGFSTYTTVLYMLEEPTYDRNLLQMLINILKMNEDLTALLKDETFAYYSTIRGIDELELYAKGRQAEEDGDLQAAISFYSQCQYFFDTTPRLLSLSTKTISNQKTDYTKALQLFAVKNYKEAAKIFKSLGDYEDSAKWAKYATAMQQYTDKKYEAAYKAFKALGDFQDARKYTTDAKKEWDASKVTPKPTKTPKTKAAKTPKPTKAPKPTDADPCAKGHDWKAATCTSPKTCSRCGKTEGSSLGHNWKAATCTEPKICSRCGKTDGKPLGHDWMAATVNAPKTCKRCGAKEGSVHTHVWAAATCTEAKTCVECGVTEGKALGHTWKAATCTSPKTCSRCGKTEGKALGHNWKAATCTSPKTCSRCGKTEGKALGHSWKAATCTSPKTCSRCGKTEGNALGHSWTPATLEAPKTCTRCGKTEGNKLSWGAWSEWSTTQVEASSTRQVETKVEQEPVYGMQYKYKRWHYYNTVHNAWYNHYKKYTGSQYQAGSGSWQYKTTTKPLEKAGTVDGHTYYVGYWYFDSKKQVQTGTKSVTYYRYRDIQQ